MAEGGDDRLPFLKNDLVDNSEKNEGMSGRKSVLHEPDLSASGKRNRYINDDEKVPSRREDNPFSFRHFLNKDQSSSEVSNSKEVRHEHAQSHSVECSLENGKPRIVSDFPSGLPDFVQDHLVLENYVFHDVNHQLLQTEPVQVPDQCLPDFAVYPSSDALSSQSKPDSSKKCVVRRSSQDDLVLDPSCKPKNIRKSAVSQSDTAVSSSLPDFLSDGPMLSNYVEGLHDVSKTSSWNQSVVHRGKVQTEDESLISLKTEKDELLIQLNEVKEKLAVESDKVYHLQKEVSNLRRKEVDENAALEKVVSQVEANLQNTTQRAVNSETVILKLRQEVKSLQSQVETLKAENMSLRNCEHVCVSRIAKKAKLASEQISAASATAEQQLKQLLSGLDSLRLVSSFLADIDRVTEDSSLDEKF